MIRKVCGEINIHDVSRIVIKKLEEKEKERLLARKIKNIVSFSNKGIYQIG